MVTAYLANRISQSLLAGVVLAMPAIHLSAQSFRDSIELEPVVITASHTPKALKDAPVVTRLITLYDIKITDATNIQDMLTQEIPGLEFGFAMSQETSLNMSGFGGNAVLFLVDGERMAGETMDNVDYNRMNLDNVGRIEIVKGASSALYGSNAVGGVINIISRGLPMSIPAIIPSDMNGATVPAFLLTPENGTPKPVSNIPRSILSICLSLTLPRRLPSN